MLISEQARLVLHKAMGQWPWWWWEQCVFCSGIVLIRSESHRAPRKALSKVVSSHLCGYSDEMGTVLWEAAGCEPGACRGEGTALCRSV